MMETNVDNESIKKAVFDMRDYYLFRRDNCSAFALDSVSYNKTAFTQLKCSYRYVVAISHVAYDVLTDLTEHYNKILTDESIKNDQLLSGLFVKWGYDESDISEFVEACQEFVDAK